VWLSNSEKSLRTCVTVLTEYWRVTADGQTDRRTDEHLPTALSTLCIASRRKNHGPRYKSTSQNTDCFLVLFQGTVRVPWLSILKCVPLYALCVAHFTCNMGYYTLLTCLPQYFKHILHFDIKSVSLVYGYICKILLFV